MFTIQTGAESYRLMAGDEEGSRAWYGQPSAVQVGNTVYYCCIEDADFDADKVEVIRVADAEAEGEFPVEEVTFEDEVEAEEEPEDNEGDED